MSGVININSDEEFASEMEKASSKVAVVDFYATWCGPCTRIAPLYIQLAAKNPSAAFLKVDVDKCQEATTRLQISAMPTFHVYRNGTKVDELRGADPVALERLVDKYCKASSNPAGNEGPVPGHFDLSGTLDLPRCECLNESDEHTFRAALKDDDNYLQSDCDEQLLLTVAFLQPVKLHSLVIKAPTDGTAPKSIKLFLNRTTIDFDGAERGSSVQDLELTKDDTGDNSLIPLKYVKFQNVSSISVFIEDNQGDEETTVINYLGFIGQTREVSDMKEFKRVSGQKGEVHG